MRKVLLGFWDDLERCPMGEARDVWWLAVSVLLAGAWIVVFAVSVLGMIDQEMSAALAEALGAITSGHLRARFVPIVKVNVADAIAPLFRHGHDEGRVREIAVDRDAVRLHVDDEPVVVVRAFDVDA